MKKLSLGLFSAFLIMLSANSQNNTMGYLGAGVRLHPSRQYLEVTNTVMGWPAEIYGLKPGYRIYNIDEKPVSEIADPVTRFTGMPGTYIQLGGKRMEPDSLFSIRIPFIGAEPGNWQLTAEGKLALDLFGSTVPGQGILSVNRDEDVDFFRYKTFDFDYTDTTDPLLEKDIFKIVEDKLLRKGLLRDRDNPDILILMKTFAGQKEQYVPPTQIISTRVETVYNWRWGLVPMPFTESQTKSGYTDITYLYSISLKVLDARQIGKTKVPPVIWSGSLSTAAKYKFSLLSLADSWLSLLFWQFPAIWVKNTSQLGYSQPYNYTGIIYYSMKDFPVIADVIPGSPAALAGIQAGDRVIGILGEKIKKVTHSNKKYTLRQHASYADGSYQPFKYLVLNISGGLDSVLPGHQIKRSNLIVSKNFKIKGSKPIPETVEFRVERNGKEMEFVVKPQPRIYSAF